ERGSDGEAGAGRTLTEASDDPALHVRVAGRRAQLLGVEIRLAERPLAVAGQLERVVPGVLPVAALHRAIEQRRPERVRRGPGAGTGRGAGPLPGLEVAQCLRPAEAADLQHPQVGPGLQ